MVKCIPNQQEDFRHEKRQTPFSFAFLQLSLTTCFSPLNNNGDGSITINLGGSRAAYTPDAAEIAELTHNIHLKGPDNQEINLELAKGQTSAVVYVIPGSWEITVKAYKEGILIAEDTKVVQVERGKDNHVSMAMQRVACIHDWNWTADTIAATCTQPSKDTAVCKNCSETSERAGSNAALGHINNSWNWATYNSTNGHVSCTRTGCGGGFAKIGDTGPAGGKIFFAADGIGSIIPGEGETAIPKPHGFTLYMDADDSTGITAYYLEAAPSDMDTMLAWAPMTSPAHGTLVTGLSTYLDSTDCGIGRGRKNTALILRYVSNNQADAPAAYACANNGAPNDWFLPSKDELNQLYNNRVAVGIPSSGTFWSSSQLHSFSAWGQRFSDGGQGDFASKDITRSVRAIRAF